MRIEDFFCFSVRRPVNLNWVLRQFNWVNTQIRCLSVALSLLKTLNGLIFPGVFYPRANHGGITYDDCKTTYDPEGGDELQSTYKPYKVSNWVVGHQYVMKPSSACRIFSLKAFIGPVSKKTSKSTGFQYPG